MKKSFMTRVLATGLSLAMAFSLSAATNVSVASAAAKPAMKSSKMTVKVGQKKNYQATAATQKAYKITKVKMSAAGKTKAKVTINSSKKSIKVEGLAATKGSNVIISFKNNKTKKTTKVTTKVVVKAVDEKLTMTAAATKVKKITVTFNKPVDTTKAVITVKKGVATIASTTTFAADAKSAELALGSRITKGTYTVTVTGLQDEPLSADVVAEDEKLTTFQLLGNNLVADADVPTTATISFKALNQYDEMVAANSLQVSSTFAPNTTVDVDPTATKVGVIKCTDITPTQAIAGTVGTIVIVDSLGTNLNAQVTYQSKAFPKTAEVVGIYNEKTEKIIEGNLKKTDTVAQYALMLNIKDQYGNEMSAAAVSKSGLQFNPAQILTDLNMPSALDAGTGGNAKDITYEGANNILVSFQCDSTKIQKAGTLNLTIVGMGGGGSLAQPVITVDEVAVIKSISVAPATAIYEGQKNDLVVEAYDADGKAVTSYDVLKAANIKIQPASGFGSVSLNKNSDGTGKFVWNMTGYRVVPVPAGDTKARNSTLSTLTISANATGNPDFMIKTQSVTVWQKCELWEVTGTTKDTVTSAASGTALTVDLSTLTYADQYGNEVKFADLADSSNIYYYITGTALAAASGSATKVSVVSNGAALASGKKIELKANAVKGSNTLYLKVYSTGSAVDITDNAVKALTDKYDLKLSLNVVDGKAIDVSDVEIASVNDGKTVYAATSGNIVLTGSSTAYAVGSGSAVYSTYVPVVVTATVNGKKVVLDPSQYTITNATVAGIATQAGVARQTVKKTVNVVVESENGALEASKEYEISNEDAKVVEIKKTGLATGVNVQGVTTGSAMTASKLGGTFKFVTQYGEDVTSSKKGDALYTVIFTGNNTGSDYYTITGDKTQKINVDFKVGGNYTATVKVVLGDASFEQDVKIAVATS